MKIATYNVNGINGRLPVLLRWLAESGQNSVPKQENKHLVCRRFRQGKSQPEAVVSALRSVRRVVEDEQVDHLLVNSVAKMPNCAGPPTRGEEDRPAKL